MATEINKYIHIQPLMYHVNPCMLRAPSKTKTKQATGNEGLLIDFMKTKNKRKTYSTRQAREIIEVS
jgi:hypothetical protein